MTKSQTKITAYLNTLIKKVAEDPDASVIVVHQTPERIYIYSGGEVTKPMQFIRTVIHKTVATVTEGELSCVFTEEWDDEPTEKTLVQ